MSPVRRRRQRPRGQALVEFALVFPIAVLAIFGIIVLGLHVFYQQQVTNVAREAARWAAVHSMDAICPTASWHDPQAPPSTYPRYPLHCDGPNHPDDAYPWPKMTDYARQFAAGVPRQLIHINACWSGYAPPGNTTVRPADYPALDPTTGTPNEFVQCTIDGRDPITDAASLGCRARMTTAADDTASDRPGNQVTVYACMVWSPPMSGLLFLPSQVTMRAVVTEAIQRQQ